MSSPLDSTTLAAQRTLGGARFQISVPNPDLLPADDGHEVAFAGRSNVGKSSALNVLCGQRALARTSRTPGRTQHLVVFDLGGGRRLVDLPGFGYAKVSKDTLAHWERALPRYLEQRRSLAGILLIVDIRHALKAQELMLIEWCGQADMPIHVLANKCDKLGRGPARLALRSIETTLAEHTPHGTAQLFSAHQRAGVAAAQVVVGRWLEIVADDEPRATRR